MDIKAVVINTHATSDELRFGNGNTMSADDISALDKKTMGAVMIYGCNAGHLDHKEDNPAAQFAKRISGGLLLASDGTVKAKRRIRGLIGSYKYSSINDSEFRSQRPEDSERDNEGWIVYQYKDNKVKTSESLGKELTLTQMLTNIGKAEW